MTALRRWAWVGVLAVGVALYVLVLVTMVATQNPNFVPSMILIGVASGMGFAALETMGYAFNALLASKGNIGAVEQTLFVRGLTAPAAHLAWTGLTAGALFAVAAAPTGRRVTLFVATFFGAVVLHALWDSFDNIVVYAVVGTISLTWFLVQLRRYRAFDPYPPHRTPPPYSARTRPGRRLRGGA
ncbi:PrsW family glutamic-type intramembrane protease [Dactylosporangium siamense]|uniref:PrsW family intramembrane metalloprotease n=1 Tax=Dactylosporangium siamense TaxID=685454 RepID=A0A919PYY7_9ACTN|nr:PrsW family glutamic-type intramembrane protease [Dactylosporangium siamense]GIG52939.1 hypothetical protein Dsi01nite_109800 [Dactylosporangium siamense]